MTRRALFLFPAQAIQMLPSGDVVRQKPLNGHCPVCGEVAPIVHSSQIGGFINCKPVDGVIRCDPSTYQPGMRITRCSFCNAAFWQDSEPTK